MLNFLQIRNYAIVESLEIDLSSGFTCISGETGAGKSILVGALGLLCGNRADMSAIRSGASRAELVAGFDLDENSPARRWLTETDLDDGAQCLLRRVINDSGRSRAWINGTAVTLQQLAELGEMLVEIHGQNEHLRLVRSDEQFRLLDGTGHHDPSLVLTQDQYYSWNTLEQEKQALLNETPLDAGDLDLMRHQVRELEDNMISAEAFTALETEHRKLAKGGEILAALESALESISSSGAAASVLHHAAAELKIHATLDADIASAASLLGEASINCDEAINSLQSALSRLDLSPERLTGLEQRLGQQHDLARKHRVEPEQLGAVLEQLTSRLELAASADKRLARIDAELESALMAYRQAAIGLHQQRSERAVKLSTDVSALMQDLGMEGGCFEIVLTLDQQSAPSARGDDRLALHVSANRGTPPGPLRKVASGGELSRISLAVKVAGRQGSPVSTQVFDEVDAGIGGETAHAVGALLKSLSSDAQALCVTHLAQVAVFADQQIKVSKAPGKGGSQVETLELGPAERVDEVARMLGGQLTEQSRAHAAELLGDAAAARH